MVLIVGQVPVEIFTEVYERRMLTIFPSCCSHSLILLRSTIATREEGRHHGMSTHYYFIREEVRKDGAKECDFGSAKVSKVMDIDPTILASSTDNISVDNSAV